MRQFVRKLTDHKPVNGFDYVRDAVRENPPMTPDDIRSRRFGRQLLGGLNPEQVSAFLEDVADAFETVQRVNTKTETYMRVLQDELEAVAARRGPLLPRDAFDVAEPRATSIIPDGEQKDEAAASRIEMLRSTALQEVEALLHDAQLRAQTLVEAALERAAATVREAEALRSQRQQEGEELVSQATAAADSIVSAARDDEAAVRREIERLVESRLRFFDDVRTTLDACREWLATVDPRLGHPTERNVFTSAGPS